MCYKHKLSHLPMSPNKVNIPFFPVPFLQPFLFGVQSSKSEGTHGCVRAEYQVMPNIPSHPTRHKPSYPPT